MVAKTKEVSQIKPCLSEGRAGLRPKIKTLIPISKPIAQATEKQTKVLVPNVPKIQDKIVPIPNYAIPHVRSKDDSGSTMVERKAIQDVSRKIPIYSDPVYRPPPTPVKTSIPKIPRSLSDIDPELYADFEENSQCDLRNVPKTGQVIFPGTTRIAKSD